MVREHLVEQGSTYQKKGGQLLLEQGVSLAEKGITSPEEVLRVAGVD